MFTNFMKYASAYALLLYVCIYVCMLSSLETYYEKVIHLE